MPPRNYWQTILTCQICTITCFLGICPLVGSRSHHIFRNRQKQIFINLIKLCHYNSFQWMILLEIEKCGVKNGVIYFFTRRNYIECKRDMKLFWFFRKSSTTFQCPWNAFLQRSCVKNVKRNLLRNVFEMKKSQGFILFFVCCIM